MKSDDLLGRIHDLEAVVNGLMIYIAAKEAGVTLDPESDAGKAFLKRNVVRPLEVRKAQYEGSVVVAADGYHDAAAIQRIPHLVQKIKEEIKD